VLVAAVLRPEEREDRQLEVVRIATEQFDDTGELPVRETEGTVYRNIAYGLFGDLGQVIQCSGEARRRPPRCERA